MIGLNVSMSRRDWARMYKKKKSARVLSTMCAPYSEDGHDDVIGHWCVAVRPVLIHPAVAGTIPELLLWDHRSTNPWREILYVD